VYSAVKHGQVKAVETLVVLGAELDGEGRESNDASAPRGEQLRPNGDRAAGADACLWR
jgi:hypothetical protein